MKVILTIGLPASGKTTFAKAYCEQNTDWVRVSRDDLRNMRGKYWLPKDEQLITSMEQTLITLAFLNGKNVIVDATNLNPKYRNNLKNDIKTSDPSIVIEERYFDLSPEECIKRDMGRPGMVGADVIWGMYYKYIAPIPVYKENIGLPHCIICDIDGTLAHNVGGRSPYAWDRVGEDKLDEFVQDIYDSYRYSTGAYGIIFSGRDSICREATESWLKANGVYCENLYMRAEGDNRKDSVVKKELFEQHIRGKYYVDFVLDDRDQVVRMWRNELGLKCLQVNWGNF